MPNRIMPNRIMPNRIMPVTHMYNREFVDSLRTCPAHDLRHGAASRVTTEQAHRLSTPHMESVRQGDMLADVGHEIALHALAEQDGVAHGALVDAGL